jgi:hypothetical protein
MGTMDCQYGTIQLDPTQCITVETYVTYLLGAMPQAPHNYEGVRAEQSTTSADNTVWGGKTTPWR